MKILALVKSVPDLEGRFRVNESGDWFDESGLSFVTNDYDRYAMEAAVRIKEQERGVEIAGLTVGPARSEAALRKALALGADRGVRIDCGRPSLDGKGTASLIAAWARDQGFDLILAGVMSEDLMQGQTGPMAAELLGLPFATAAVGCELDRAAGVVRVERELEGGRRERVELPLPCLVTVQTGINHPRYASLSNVLRVQELEIEVVDGPALGAAPSSALVYRMQAPPAGSCEFLEGDLADVARALVERIRSRVQAG